MLNHLGTINLETENLLLRKLTINDTPNYFKHITSDPDIMWVWGVHNTIDKTYEWIEKIIKNYEKINEYEWGIELKENKEVIGSICIVKTNEEIKSGSLGYQISKHYRNKGYMTEALVCVLNYLINKIGYNRIEGGHSSDNPASGRVMEKAGMKYEGTLRQDGKNKNGILVNGIIYSLIKEDIR